MLKRLVAWKYGIAVVIVLGGSIYVSRQDQKTRKQYEQKCNQLNASAASPARHYEDCDKGAEEAVRDLPLWYQVFGWPEGITACAILLTLLVIAEQTGQTRKAAEAALESAKAAIAQIELMKSKERARLTVKPVSLEVETDPESEGVWNLRTSINVDNIGLSKAFDIKGRASLWVQDSCSPISHELMLPWDDGPAFRVSAEPGSYIAHVDSQVLPLTMDQFLEGIIGGGRAVSIEGETFTLPEKTVYLQGFFEYETMGVRFRRKFGWVWYRLGVEDGGTVLGGTSEEGYWVQDDKQENGECEIPPN